LPENATAPARALILDFDSMMNCESWCALFQGIQISVPAFEQFALLGLTDVLDTDLPGGGFLLAVILFQLLTLVFDLLGMRQLSDGVNYLFIKACSFNFSLQ
jgi:hypothetical protein